MIYKDDILGKSPWFAVVLYDKSKYLTNTEDQE